MAAGVWSWVMLSESGSSSLFGPSPCICPSLLASLTCLALRGISVYNPCSSGLSHKAKPDRSSDMVTKLAPATIFTNKGAVIINSKSLGSSGVSPQQTEHFHFMVRTSSWCSVFSGSHFSFWKGKQGQDRLWDTLYRRRDSADRSCSREEGEQLFPRGRQTGSGSRPSCQAPALIRYCPPNTPQRINFGTPTCFLTRAWFQILLNSFLRRHHSLVLSSFKISSWARKKVWINFTDCLCNLSQKKLLAKNSV